MKKIYNYEMPKKINNSTKTFEFLSKIYLDLKDKRKCEIYCDFSNTRWIDGYMCSPLGAILESIKENKNTIFIRDANEKIKKFFINNSFIKCYNANNSLNYNIIKYKGISKDDNKEFEKYLLSEVGSTIRSNELNVNTNALKKVITEIFINIAMHTDSQKAYLAGVYLKQNRKFEFAITNIGRTMFDNMLICEMEFKDDIAAIEWSLKKNNSTSRDTRTKGLGLYELVNYTKNVDGKIKIVSGYGEVVIGSNGTIYRRILKEKFPGTAIFIDCYTNRIPYEKKIKNTKIISLGEIGGI